jgi:hypothetical protein
MTFGFANDFSKIIIGEKCFDHNHGIWNFTITNLPRYLLALGMFVNTTDFNTTKNSACKLLIRVIMLFV